MRVVITGGHGFLGWHVAARLRSLGVDALRLGRDDLADPRRLAAAVASADVVLHAAGVNRAESDEAVRSGNVALARSLSEAITAGRRPVRVVYADSVHAGTDTPYGRGKAQAADVLGDAVSSVGGSLADVLLPHLFGEHGRPGYNSFVATFCHAVAEGRAPRVSDDKEVALLHVQAAAGYLIDAMTGHDDVRTGPAGEPRRVSDVAATLEDFHGLYSHGEIPALTDPFRVDLFNTYRSYVFPQLFPVRPRVHADDRGELVETSRSHGGPGQSFVSTTRPGATRGDHYHLRKVERFFVVRGEAEIALRRLLHDDVVRFRVSGSAPGYVDMPTLWVHNITNVGQGDLVTVFWADQLLDADRPDQYAEPVEPAVSPGPT